jgi:hypothetical protein
VAQPNAYAPWSSLSFLQFVELSAGPGLMCGERKDLRPRTSWLPTAKPELKVCIAGEERLRSRDGQDSPYGPRGRVGE